MPRHLATLTLALALTSQAHAQNVTTYHNGVNRHGEYTVPGLTLSAAAAIHPDTGFNGTVSGNIYAQPLYYKPANRATGLVIVATESNQVTALDATSGLPVWTRQLPAAAARSALQCGNIDPEGITGTPVIDPAAGRIYLDALTDVAPIGVRHKIYALNAATGAIIPNWPIDVQTALAAKSVSFDSTAQGARSALLQLGSQIYVSFGGRYGDCGNYHGMVVQINPAATPSVAAVWSTRAHGGGIWAQGGAASDGTYIFATTGNTMGASAWGDGEAILKLSPGLAHATTSAGYFTPSNWQTLDNEDLDLGGTEAIPFTIPVPGKAALPRIIAFGKDGNAYLVDRGNLGGIGGAVAIAAVSNGQIRTAPAIYNTASMALVGFYNESGKKCGGSSISMLSVSNSATTPIKESWCASLSGAGAPIITTTDGTANPILWITGAEGDNKLHGFNALTGATIYAGGTTEMSGLRHFGTILAANNRLYTAGTNKIYAFAFNN